jgi:excisionase family DNA binding protein
MEELVYQQHSSSHVQTMTKLRQEFEGLHRKDVELKERPTRRLLRTKCAAAYLGLSEWKLRRLVQEGQIPVVQYREGAPWLVDLCDLDRWIAEKKQVIPV